MSADREAVAAFEAAYRERARDALAGVEIEAILAGRRPPPGSGPVVGGWWCRPGEDESVSVLPNPWDDRDAVVLYDEYAFGLGRSLAQALAVFFNEHHGTDHPSAYWELLIEPWLHLTVSEVLDRALFVRTTLDLFDTAPFLLEGPLPVHATMQGATNEQLTDGWSAQLVSELAGALGYPAQQSAGLQPDAPHEAARKPPSLRSTLPAVARQLALGGRRRRSLALIGQHRLRKREILALRRSIGGIRPAPQPRLFPRSGELERSSATVDTKARGRLSQLDAGSDRELPLTELLPRLVPMSLIERYAALVADSVRDYGPPSPILDGSYSFLDVENEFIARSKASGHRTAAVQHGGATLCLRAHPPDRLATGRDSHFDDFIGWGPAPGARAIPHPYLERLRDSHRGGEKVVVVEGAIPPVSQVIRFSSVPLANQVFTELDLLVALVEAVGRVREHLFLKRYPTWTTESGRPPALEALPQAHSRRRRSAIAWMRAARVAVLAYPDTPFLEAMVLGVPTIGIWDTSLWNWTDDAKEPFDALERAGVVFSDPQAAAAKLDVVYERADDWWAGTEIQAARQAFLDRFAIGGDWLEPWTQTLSEIASASDA